MTVTRSGAIESAARAIVDGWYGEGIENIDLQFARLRDALALPDELPAAAEAVIGFVPLRTVTPERWMARQDERKRAAITELRRLVGTDG